MMPPVVATTSSSSAFGKRNSSWRDATNASKVTSDPVKPARMDSTCDRPVNAAELTRIPGAPSCVRVTPRAAARSISWVSPLFSVVPEAGHDFVLDRCQGQRFIPPAYGMRVYTREEYVSQLGG